MLSGEFWAFAERYIAIDTQPGTGNVAIEPFVLEVLAPLAPRITLQRGSYLGKSQVNVLASFGPQGPGGLLLVTHSDTVPQGPIERWTEGPPLKLTRTGDGRLIGLGTVDVKLDYLCKAFALRGIDLSRLKKPLHLLATYGEEVGLLGTKAFIAEKIVQPEWVLCGEPSELIPCHAHKGYAMTRVRATLAPSGAPIVATQEITAQGKAAHSSTPHLGQNAITLLLAQLGDAPVIAIKGGSSSNTVPAFARALVAGGSGDAALATGHDLRPAVAALQHAWAQWVSLATRLSPQQDAEFTPAEVVCNWGMLEEEPGALTATFDARLLPQHNPDALHSAFNEALRAFVPAGVSLDTSIERAAAGMRADPDGPLLRAVSAAVVAEGLDGIPKAKATSTEAGAFFHAGFSAAVFGPGVSVGNAHTPNEWNRVRDLELATRIYERVIATLCF